MKENIIKIKFNAEKIMALESVFSKKNTTLDKELMEALEKLYEKNVPNQVQEFIQTKEEKAKNKIKKQKSKSKNEDKTATITSE